MHHADTSAGNTLSQHNAYPVILSLITHQIYLFATYVHLKTQSLEPWVSEQLLPSFTHPAPDQWQPSDWLPDPSSSTFLEDLQSLREATQQLPNDLLVVIAGMAVAEEGAPNYLSLMNAMEETGDETGAQSHGWAR